MKKANHLLFLASGFLLALPARAEFMENYGWSFQGGNLVANWSFENLTTEICGPENPYAYGTVTDCRLKSAEARTGNYVLRTHMQNQGPTDPVSWAVSQTSELLQVDPEIPYHFEVQYQVAWSEKMATARAVIGFLDGQKNVLGYQEGPRYLDLNGEDVTTWSTYGFEFTPPSQTRYLYFHLVQADNDGASGAGDIYLFDNLILRRADAPSSILETRSYLDAVGREDHGIFTDGTQDIVYKKAYDPFGRLKESYLPFTLSGLVLSDITISALDLSGEMPVDFHTLQEGYAGISEAVSTTAASQLPAEIHAYVITHADEFAPIAEEAATLVPLVSVDGQAIPLILEGTVYGSQTYVDLKTRRGGTVSGHLSRGPFTGDVEAALASQYPGESNQSLQLEYPDPGVNRISRRSLPGHDYGLSAHFQKSGSALIRSPAIPPDPEGGGDTDPGQAEYHYSWSRDAQGRYAAQIVDARGLVVKSATSAEETLSGESDWLVTENFYDSFDRLEQTRSPQNFFTAVAYDGMSRPIHSVDPDRGATDVVYDSEGRPRFTRTAHGLAEGYFIANRYDAVGRLIGSGKVDLPGAFTQANADNPSFPTSFFLNYGLVYDDLEPSRFTEATGVTLSSLGFVPPVKHGQGQVVAAYNRNLETEAPGVTQAKDKLVATFDSYDSLGRLKERWQYLGPAPSGRKWHKFKYTYDSENRLVSTAVYQDQTEAQMVTFSKYIYDLKGRVAQVVDENGQERARYHYNFQNRTTEVDLLSQVHMGYSYDIQGKTRSITAKADGAPQPYVFSEYLGYEDKPYAGMANSLDPSRKRFDGTISSLVRKFSSSAPNPVEWWQYGYDIPGRMESSGKHLSQGDALNPDGTLAPSVAFQSAASVARDFQYDDDGRIQSQFDGQTAYGYAYAEGAHQLDHVSPAFPNRDASGTGNFQYDEIGRMVQDVGRGQNTQYNFADQPVEIGVGGTRYHMFYGPENFRVVTLEETTPGQISASKTEVYESGLKVVKEMVHREVGHPQGALDLEKDYHYGQGGLVAVSYAGQPGKHILLKDHQGSVMGVVATANGVLAKEQGYLPYGEIETRVGSGTDLQVNQAFTGKEYVEALGLYDFGARWYDPELGMWLVPDAAGQYTNPYSYGGDPINGVDPDGNWFWIDDAIATGLGAVAGYVGYGLSTGDWTSSHAWASAALGAAAGEAALYTGGATLTYFGGAAAAGVGGTLAAGAAGGAVGGLVSGLGGYSVGAAYGDNSFTMKGALTVASISFGTGAISGFAGAGASQFTSGLVIGGTQIASPIARGVVSGMIGGAAGGYAGGFAGTLLSGGSLSQAYSGGFNGMFSGAAMGGVGGGINGYANAVRNNVDPWTGQNAIKSGSAEGPTAGMRFPNDVKAAARAENPGSVCVYCRTEGPTQVDHVIPLSRGGNATLDNAQLACPWCNASKGARDYPLNPPPNYEGSWPPSWWSY